MPNTPSCLHFQAVTDASGSIFFSWAAIPGAAGYELELSHETDFGSAATGLCWDMWDAQGNPWQEDIALQLSWDGLEALPAKGCTWGDFARADLTWSEFKSKGWAWRDLWGFPVNFRVYRGNGDGTGPGPDTDPAGMCWDSADARFFTWQQMETADKTWTQLENAQPDSATHIHALVKNLPPYSGWLWLRLRAYDAQGEYSAWFATGKQLGYTREDILLHKDTLGKFTLQMQADMATSLQNKVFAILYDAEAMDVNRKELKKSTSRAHIRILNKANGKIQYRCEREIPVGTDWSGLLGRVSFTGKGAESSSVQVMVSPES